jgi:hypothetical protein
MSRYLVGGTRLTFDAGNDNALDEIALSRNKDHEHRDEGDKSHRHDVLFRDVVERSMKHSQAQGYREFLGAVDIDQGVKKVVPVPQELVNRHDAENRLGQGQDDAPID